MLYSPCFYLAYIINKWTKKKLKLKKEITSVGYNVKRQRTDNIYNEEAQNERDRRNDSLTDASSI